MKKKTLFLLLMLLALPLAMMAGNGKFTLVIDAGHGGRDSGAKGSSAYEKNINLKVALAFGSMVERNCPDVKVIYTPTETKPTSLSVYIPTPCPKERWQGDLRCTRLACTVQATILTWPSAKTP